MPRVDSKQARPSKSPGARILLTNVGVSNPYFPDTRCNELA